MNFGIFSIVFCVITAMNNAALADTPPQAVPVEFTQKIMAAFNSHNLDNFMPLFHPKYAACITPENKAKFAYGIWWGRKTDTITPDYKTSEEPVDPKMAEVNDETKNPNAKFQKFPAIPDSKLNINYVPKPNSSVGKLFFIVV